jgi:MYXO-CTERM domain-containing protein
LLLRPPSCRCASPGSLERKHLMSISRLFSFGLPVAAMVAVLSYAPLSRADVLPPDGCTGAAGSSCDNAGPNNDEPGVCVSTTCPHADPDADGGSVQEACVLCQQTADASASDATASGDGSVLAGPGKASSNSSCSTSPHAPSGGGLGLMLAAAAVAGAVQRRRRAA